MDAYEGYRYCGRCGAKNLDRSLRCTTCGLEFVKPEYETITSYETKTVNMRLVAIAAISVIVLIIGAFAIANYDNTPTEHYSATYEVKIINYYYEPVTITMQLGNDVKTFENVEPMKGVSHKFTVKWEGKNKATNTVKAVYSANGEKSHKYVYKNLVFSPSAKGTYAFCINDQIISKEETIYVK